MARCAAQAVFFDFGGVVAEEGFKSGLADLAEARGHNPHAVIRAGLEAMWDPGSVTGPGGGGAFRNSDAMGEQTKTLAPDGQGGYRVYDASGHYQGRVKNK